MRYKLTLDLMASFFLALKLSLKELVPTATQGRRLFTSLARARVVINMRTREDAAQKVLDTDVATLASELTVAAETHPTLGDFGLVVEPETVLETAFALVICPLKRAIPPGFPVVSPAECQCAPGFGYDTATETCEPCATGTYKARSVEESLRAWCQGSVGDLLCTRCPDLMTTPQVGSLVQEQCACEDPWP